MGLDSFLGSFVPVSQYILYIIFVSLVLLLHITLSFIMPDFIVLYGPVCFCFHFEGREK